MVIASEQSVSVWMDRSEPLRRPQLLEDALTDVCVVGAGIAGLSVAYTIARAGRKVLVVDGGPIAGGQTQRTSAHLSSAIDDRFHEIERVHGSRGMRLAAESHAAAIDRIEQIAAEESIDCDFRRVDGYLFLPAGASVALLERELDAARRAGITNAEMLDQAPIADYKTGPCILFPGQARLDPMRYVAGLARAIEKCGGRIHTSTHVTHIDGGPPARIQSSTGPAVICSQVVVATNTPINDLFSIHTKQAPYISYVIAAAVPSGSVSDALFWDTEDPYHYVRLLPGGGSSRSDRSRTTAKGNSDLLIVGGEDHKTGQAEDGEQRWRSLESWARTRFPMIQDLEYRWSGQIMETIDGLGFIGRNPGDKDNVYVATGDSGMGLTHGAIAGMLISDLVLGRENRWSTLYEPSRKPLRAIRSFARENINAALQYSEWLTGSELDSIEQLQPNSGAVMREGLRKIAVYRDAGGSLHHLSAACTHLGCIVDWNAAENTWDCPCHGSRFDKYGKVISGPATENLARTDEKQEGPHGTA